MPRVRKLGKSSGRTEKNGRDDRMKNNLIKGVAGVAVTAGVIAAGLMLANKKNRKALGRGAKTIFDKVSEVTKTAREQSFSPAVAHRVNVRRRKRQSVHKMGKPGMPA